MIFEHAEITQAGANDKTARPTRDLQLFHAQPAVLLNFTLDRSENRTAGTLINKKPKAELQLFAKENMQARPCANV